MCFCEDRKRGEGTKEYFCSDELLAIVDGDALAVRKKARADAEAAVGVVPASKARDSSALVV